MPLLREALALWRGAPLADVPGTPVLTAWAKELDERRYTALEGCLAAELELGRHTLVVGELSRLVTIAPLREELRASLMLALYRCGRQAEALAVFREGRRLLVEELGIEPGPSLRVLERAILEQDPGLDAKGTSALVTESSAELVARGVALGESWYTSLRLREPSAFAALDQNAASLAQAVRSAIEEGDRSSALRIIGTTWFYWLIRGRHEEAYAWSKTVAGAAGQRVARGRDEGSHRRERARARVHGFRERGAAEAGGARAERGARRRAGRRGAPRRPRPSLDQPR